LSTSCDSGNTWSPKAPADRQYSVLGCVDRTSVHSTSGRASAGAAFACYTRHMTAGRPLLLNWSVPGECAGRGMVKGSGLGRFEAPWADGSAFQEGLTPCGAGPLRQPARSPARAPGRAGARRVLAVPARCPGPACYSLLCLHSVTKLGSWSDIYRLDGVGNGIDFILI